MRERHLLLGFLARVVENALEGRENNHCYFKRNNLKTEDAQMTEEEFNPVMDRMINYFPQRPDPEAVKAEFWRVVQHLDAAEFKICVASVINTEKFWPTPQMILDVWENKFYEPPKPEQPPITLEEYEGFDKDVEYVNSLPEPQKQDALDRGYKLMKREVNERGIRFIKEVSSTMYNRMLAYYAAKVAKGKI
jgi:hypothetical protein